VRVAARWGRLLGANAAGALIGAVLANFAGMRYLGLWVSFAVWSALALLAALLVMGKAPARGQGMRLGLALAAAGALIITFPRSLPVAALSPGDTVLAWRAGADGIAAVVASSGATNDRRIKLNNTYTLGGIDNAAQQARMGHLALLLHPRPRRVGFIGIATGITASAALRDPAVESVTAVELSPEITALACEAFADANANLCSSDKVRVVVEDGRMFFRATRSIYDVIVGDLFVPWQAGTANLYTREQFEAVRDRLAAGGLFAQWLPLFQLDAVGFWGIAATFAAVFPNAWLGIADFQPSSPALMLVGWRDRAGAPSRAVLERRCLEVLPLARLREPMLADADGVASFLVGPVPPVLPPGVPLMTLDRPWLADHAPRVQRARPEGWFVGRPLVASLAGVAAAATDDSLRASIALGQRLFEFCDIVEREGAERAGLWLDQHLGRPLPSANFLVDQPARMNWPFRREAGLLLLAKARREAAPRDQATTAGSPP
jgi:spermidine synthase